MCSLLPTEKQQPKPNKAENEPRETTEVQAVLRQDLYICPKLWREGGGLIGGWLVELPLIKSTATCTYIIPSIESSVMG